MFSIHKAGAIRSHVFAAVLCALLLADGRPLAAQGLPQVPSSAPPAPPAAPAAPADPLGRDTPRGTITGFNMAAHRDDLEVAARYLQAARDVGLKVAVVSSSANTRDVLEVTGLATFVQCRVDGVTLREEGIAGKPAPDSFLRAAELLGVQPAVAAVFEDAISGVLAGRAGDFGCVVGVDRAGHADALRRNGADLVVQDLGELL